MAKFRRRIAQAETEAIRLDPTNVTVPSTAEVPDELNDRAADSWEPLLAIADVAGGTWPVRGRQAAIVLSSEEDRDVSTGMRLLADIRDVFEGADHLATAELLSRLHDLDEAPWAEWYGKPLTARGLSRLLEPYRVAPLRRRVAGQNRRGYFRAEFADAWARYVPVSGPGTPGTPGTDNDDDYPPSAWDVEGSDNGA